MKFSFIDINENYIDEIVTALTRINYGQNTQINALAGYISLIGSGNSVFSVKEGYSIKNKKI